MGPIPRPQAGDATGSRRPAVASGFAVPTPFGNTAVAGCDHRGGITRTQGGVFVDVDRPDRRRRPVRSARRRATDRVEDAVAWLLTALALITTLAAFAVGQSGYGQAMDRVRAETADRTMVRAVLVDQATAFGPQQVGARWPGPGGVVVTGQVRVRERRPAGAEVLVWFDGEGRVADAPMQPSAAVAAGWIRGVLAALSGWSLLALLWVGVRRLVASRNAAAWAREWERVEPSWSGRA